MWSAATLRCQRSVPPTMRHSPHFSILSRDRPLHTFRSEPYSHDYSPPMTEYEGGGANTDFGGGGDETSGMGCSGFDDDRHCGDSGLVEDVWNHQDRQPPSRSGDGHDYRHSLDLQSSLEDHPNAHLRVHIPDLYGDPNNCPAAPQGRSGAVIERSRSFKAYNNRYQPGEDTSMLANELPEPEDSITAASSRMFALYNANNPNSQPLTFHHGNYPTRNLNYTSRRDVNFHLTHAQFVNLHEDVRVELPYSRRDFRRGIGVLGDSMYPNRIENEAIVGPSYQQIEGVGCERGREWTGRPLIDEGVTKEWIRTVGIVSISSAFVLLIIICVKVINTLVLILFLFSLLTAGFMLLLFTVKTWTERGRRRRQQPSAPQLSPTRPTYQETAFQTSDTFLSESDGVVTKKRLSDSPPPYENPPDYHSLPPEILMDARSLEDLCQQPRCSDEHGQLLKVADDSEGRGSEILDDHQPKQNSSSRQNQNQASVGSSQTPESHVQNVDHISHVSSTSSTSSAGSRLASCQLLSMKKKMSEMPEASNCKKSPTLFKRASQFGSKMSTVDEADVSVHKRRKKKKYERKDVDASTSCSVPMLGCRTDDFKQQDLETSSGDAPIEPIVTFQGDMIRDSFSKDLPSRGKKKVKESEGSEILDRLELNFPHNSYDYIPKRANRRLQFTLKIPSLTPQIHANHGDRTGTSSSSMPLIPYFSPSCLQTSGDEARIQIENVTLTQETVSKINKESTPEPRVPSTSTNFQLTSAQLSVATSFEKQSKNRKTLSSSKLTGDAKFKTVKSHSAYSISEENTSKPKHFSFRRSVSPPQPPAPSPDSTVSRSTSPMEDSMRQTSSTSSSVSGLPPPAYEEIHFAIDQKTQKENENESSESDTSSRVQFTISL